MLRRQDALLILKRVCQTLVQEAPKPGMPALPLASAQRNLDDERVRVRSRSEQAAAKQHQRQAVLLDGGAKRPTFKAAASRLAPTHRACFTATDHILLTEAMKAGNGILLLRPGISTSSQCKAHVKRRDDRVSCDA